MKKILLFTSILFLTFTTSLLAQAPTNLQAANITSISAELSWDASTCGANVNLRYRVVGGSWNPNVNGVTSPHLLTGLLANTDYEWTVKCITFPWQNIASFTTLGPTISSAIISQPILCNGDYLSNTMQIVVNQTASPTAYKCLVGYYPFPGYFLSYEGAYLTTATTLNLTGFNPNIDYCVRILDSIDYYTANGGSSGSSTLGIYDEWCVINFSEPDSLIASTSIIASNLCNSDCIAAEDLLISGGTGPYSFTVNGGTSINLPTGDSAFSFVALCANNYDIVVTDANGCSTSPSTTTIIIAPIPLIVPGGDMFIYNLNGYHVSCNGESDGIITASASGGTGLFTYSIDGTNFQSSAIFSGLLAGTYTITYKDSNDCIATESFILNEPPALSGTASVTQNVDCYNVNTGEITFTVDPAQLGIPAYQYSDDNGASYQPSAIFSNLLGNINYDIMVMDNNGCQFTSTVYLAEPTEVIYITTLSNYNSYEVSCNSFSDGSIDFTSTVGGSVPYAYSTDNGITFNPTTLYSGLPSGTYNVKVRDDVGCIVSSVVNLDDPGIFSVPHVVSNAIDCPGDCDGAISISPVNGVGQVVYSIITGSTQTTPYFSGLCGDITNGSYTLNAVDSNGCTANATFSIAEPTYFVYTTDSIPEYCNLLDGEASISITGGTGILSYIWNSNSLQNSSVLDSVAAGIYTVDVTDENDCPFSESVTVLSQEGFTISFTTLSPCLGDSSGSATVSVTGSAPYTYQWSTANGIYSTLPLSTAPFSTIIDMPIGTYSVDVTDNTDCVIGGSIDIISATNAITIDSLVVNNFSCFGINDAQIEIFASGGLLPYNYSNTYGSTTISNLTNPVFGPLDTNSYTLKAFDTNGCFDDTIVTLSYPDFLEIDSTVFTHITCFGADDGAVQNIQFVGGTGPFEFTIDGGVPQTYMLFSGLDPGQHTVEVFDVNNCANSDIIFINEPDELVLDSISISNWENNNYEIRCNGDSSGYIYLDFSGGTAPYLTDNTTFWNTITIDSLWADNHTFTVQDANGCTYQDSILFQEPSSIEHNFIINHVTCNAWNNGSVTDSVYGGVGSATTYSYLWDSGETTYSLSNMSAATYTITVTDENGCEDTDSVIINADSALNATLGAPTVDVGCFDDCDGELSVTVSGGLPFTGSTSYTYLWNDYLGQNTATAVGLCVDSITLSTFYDCIVTDAAGCEDTVSLELEQPEELQVDVLITNPISCNGLSDGKLKAIVTGGELAYAYTWSNGVTFNGGSSSTISSLLSGIYEVIVEDANTCRDTFEIDLNEPTTVEILMIEELDIKCFDGDDGSIQVLAIEGTSFELTYSYTLYLNGIQDTNVVDYVSGFIDSIPYTFLNLVPGNYHVIAKDWNGCEVTSESVEITQPFAPLTVLVDTVDETCLLNAPGQNGIIRIFPEGGSQIFKYFIDGVQTPTSSNFSPNALISEDIILPGWHNILVVDSRNCSISDATYIKAYDPIFLPDTVSKLEYTICLGQSINIDTEERPNLTYTWNDGVVGGDRVIKPEGMLPYGTTDGYIADYIVTVTNLQGCEIQDTVKVNFDAIDPMIDSDPGSLPGEYPVVLEGGNIDLFSNNTGNDIEYTWKWADNIIINTGDNSITISGALADVWYYLDIKDADGCLGYDSIYVVVGVKSLGESTVYEAFTPNGDTYNDVWNILNIASYPTAIVQVFNRWGALVHETSGGDGYVAWDGTYYNDGKELPVGTYYYIIDLNTGDEPQTGPITIIR